MNRNQFSTNAVSGNNAYKDDVYEVYKYNNNDEESDSGEDFSYGEEDEESWN